MESPNFERIVSAFAQQVAALITAHIADMARPVTQRLLTVEKAAAYLGRTTEAVQHMLSADKLPSVRLDRRVFIDIQDLDNIIERHKSAPR